jgi:hypothetical protein
VGNKTVEEMGCQRSNICEVPVAVPPFLLGSKKLDENLRLTPRKLINGVAMCGEIDQAGFVDVVPVIDADGSNLAKRAFELA